MYLKALSEKCILVVGDLWRIFTLNDTLNYLIQKYNDTIASDKSLKSEFDKIIINEILMRKMVEWDIKMKVLSDKERQYVADIAYGLENINEFHRSNVRRHLKKIVTAGFKF
mgnify:CR=1 FL=1